MTLKGVPKRALDGCYMWAKANRSDPFAFNVAMSHTLNGTAGLTLNGQDAFYSAQEYQEEKILPLTGEKYHVPAYRNMVRP